MLQCLHFYLVQLYANDACDLKLYATQPTIKLNNISVCICILEAVSIETENCTQHKLKLN